MRGGRATRELAGRRVDVVEQDPHPHAPFSRGDDSKQQQVGRQVVTDAVVLQVERAFRRVGQRGPCDESRTTAGDDLKA